MSQSYGHDAANCGSEIKITIVDGVPVEAPDSDFDDFAYHLNLEESDDYDYEQEGSDVECNCIQTEHFCRRVCILTI